VNKTFVGTALIAVLSIALDAHASCADPRAGAQAGTLEHLPLVDLQQRQMVSHLDAEDASVKTQNANQAIVGTWVVVYATDGTTTGEAFIQWHSDGTEWENINYPVLGGNICLGSWRAVDQSHVSRNHYGWLYDNGILAGYFDENETDELASDGNSYTGINTTVLYFLSGPPVILKGTASAKRIAP
jgi:hypothetical protein